MANCDLPCPNDQSAPAFSTMVTMMSDSQMRLEALPYQLIQVLLGHFGAGLADDPDDGQAPLWVYPRPVSSTRSSNGSCRVSTW